MMSVKLHNPILFAVLVAGLSLLFLARLPHPFVWVFLLWLVFFLVLAFGSEKRGAKVVAVNGLLIALICLVLETVLWIEPDLGREKTYQEEFTTTGGAAHGFQIFNEVLGTRPEKNQKGVSVKTWRNEVLYEMTATIDSNSLRITPSPKVPNAPAVLFFGCSYTYGTGVNDEETVPCRVVEKSGYAYHAFNFGVPGYGPHHMLAALESGMVDETIHDADPVVIIYQGADFHADRVAGRSFWDLDGPWYELDKKSGVKRLGSFRDKYETRVLRNHLIDILQKSSIVVRFFSLKHGYKVLSADIRLMVAIIKKSHDLCKSKYPDAQFHVIFWDEFSSQAPKIMKQLRDHGITVHAVNNFAPEIKSNSDVYHIPKDWHPTAEAHELIATYIVDHILNK